MTSLKHPLRPALFLAFLIGSLCTTHVLAQPAPPDESFYTGGPDDYNGPLQMSEVWTLKDLDPDEPHDSLTGKKIALRRAPGGQFFLMPAPGLNWTPNQIRLIDHPNYEEYGDIAQWRFITMGTVRIDNHAHTICIGFPDLGTAFVHDDKMFLDIVDQGEECQDPTQQHPGHAEAEK